jgi:hypothetical protein
MIAPLAGWTYQRSIGRWVDPKGEMAHVNPPEFSSDIAAAWTVVEALNSSHLVEITQRLKPQEGGFYFAVTFIGLQQLAGEYGKADTLPLAICRAALLAATPPTEEPAKP